MKNKKGELSSFSIFYFMIAIFLFVVMSAGLIWTMGELNDVFTQVGIINDQVPRQNYTFPCINDPTQICTADFYVNMTEASDAIWGSAYDSIQALRMVSIVYILSLAACIIIIGFLERKHPFLFFVYILITLLAVIFAPTISNAYEGLLVQGIFEGELANFTTANFLMLNLPTIVLIIGVLGGIGLFINLVRTGNEGVIR